MSIDLNSLLEKAFHAEDVGNASDAIERARERYEQLYRTGGVSFELVVPPTPDETWVRERLLRPLVYVCESEGRPLPGCGGIFLSLFTGARLHCVAAKDVLDWARQGLAVSVDELRAQYGTHEEETAQR